MRVPTATYLAKRNARSPQNEDKVPFKEMLPLRLRNSVSGKGDSNSDVACLQDMAVLLACLKTNDFVEQFCHREITQFKRCYKTFLDRKASTAQTINQGIITPGNNLDYRQLNKYMRRYPNP